MLDLDACAYQLDPGHRLRVSRRRRRLAEHDRSAGAGDAHRARRIGRAAALGRLRAPSAGFAPGAEHSSEDPEGVDWSITRDVLRRTTHLHGPQRLASTTRRTTAPRCEDYSGEVGVDRRTFAQSATAETHVPPDLARRRRPASVLRRCASTSTPTATTW